MAVRLKKIYDKDVKKNLLKKFSYKSVMQVPMLEKVILNVGIGDAHSNTTLLNTTMEELAKITGQKAAKTVAKKSISNFKIREGYEGEPEIAAHVDSLPWEKERYQ